MEQPEGLQGKGVLLEKPIHARCGISTIAIQEIGPSMLVATHFDRIYLGQSRALSIPGADGPLIIACRVAKSQVTDWRDKTTGRCLYKTVFEFTELTTEMQQALERLVSGAAKSEQAT